MSRLINITFLIIVIFFSACGNSKERIVIKEKEMPAWYLKPPVSNSVEMYAVGEGKDKQEALSNALSSLLATLSVSISSKYSAKSIVKEGRINSHDATYVNETHSEVKKIRISSYDVLQAQKLGFKKYAVLVKVDRIKFFRSLKKEIDQEFAIIDSWEKVKTNKNALERFAFYNKEITNLNDLQNRLLVMSVLNEEFDSKPYLKKYEKLLYKKDQLLASITFWVGSNYKPLITPIAKGLSSKKFRIKKLNNKNHFNVFIKASMQKANSYGFYIIRSEISIVTYDNRKNRVATNVLNITGQSSQSYAIAKQDVAKKLRKLVDKEGIAKILNLDI